MNAFDGVDVDKSSAAWADLLDQHTFVNFDPVFGSLTVVGATSYKGRMYFSGSVMHYQVQFSATTSVASTDGTTYLQLPFTAKGLSGMAQLTDETANTDVTGARVKISNSRVYLPGIVASAHVFNLSGWTEI